MSEIQINEVKSFQFHIVNTKVLILEGGRSHQIHEP